MIRATERAGVEQQDAPILCRDRDDVLASLAEQQGRSRELDTALPEPILHGQRLRIERDDRVRVGPGGDCARPDRHDEGAVSGEGD